MVEALQNKYGIIVMSHVSVVAATVQKILDDTAYFGMGPKENIL